MRRTSWIIVLAVRLLAACSSKDKEPPPPPITYQPVPTPEAAPDRPVTAAEVPVVEDFDEDSEVQINADNFRTELDRIEAEISADKTP